MEALVVVKRNAFVIGIAVMLTLLVRSRLTGVTWALPFVSSLPTGVLRKFIIFSLFLCNESIESELTVFVISDGVPGDLVKV
jgi:hypothetical protein